MQRGSTLFIPNIYIRFESQQQLNIFNFSENHCEVESCGLHACFFVHIEFVPQLLKHH